MERQRLPDFMGRVFVPILYREPAFDSFEDFSGFVESVTYVT
jgi:hypothetical protein